ncbi:MAG: GNAT family N-acetyltransferase [Gemmatimonadetes bacterium]|nr:GNAT family N-acetyltransferase [Gemmatimonadota bacterium]
MTEPRLDLFFPATAAIAYPIEPAAVPNCSIEAGRYQVRFARAADDLDRILALRYQIFNLELGEGLDQSHRSGRDEDDLDGRMHHLMIRDRRTDEVVGTYRMQTADMAASRGGFYSAQEFDLGRLPREVIAASVEIGRACVAREHRNGRVLSLLWRGLAEYLTWNRKHFLFGCCSLTSQDPDLGVDTHRYLEGIGAAHPTLAVLPRTGFECRPSRPPTPGPAHIPALFQSYLNLGAKVLGPPAIDRQFKTIDWLVMLDVREIDPMTYRHFFR